MPWCANTEEPCNRNPINSISNDGNLQAPATGHKVHLIVGRDGSYSNANQGISEEIGFDHFNIRDIDPEWRDDDSDLRATFDITFDRDQAQAQSDFRGYNDLGKQATSGQRNAKLAPSLLHYSSSLENFGYTSPSTTYNPYSREITNQCYRPSTIDANQSFRGSVGNNTRSFEK